MSVQPPILAKLLHELEEMQAQDIKVLDVHKQTTVTDFMIIATGRASRHVKAVAQKVMEELKAAGTPALNCTGLESSEWVLVDFGDVIVHIMQAETRQFYNLEVLWEENP